MDARLATAVGALTLAALAACGEASGGPQPSGPPSSVQAVQTGGCTPSWTTMTVPLPPDRPEPVYGLRGLQTGTTVSHVVEGMSAVSRKDVWAVGQSADANGLGLALAEHWDGRAWSIIPVAHAGSALNRYDPVEELRSVAAVSANNVWAVGSYPHGPAQQYGGRPRATLIEHWNGTAWSIVPAPDLTGNDWLTAVSAVSANDVWAVGSALYAVSNGVSTYSVAIDVPLVEHWDGHAWKSVTVHSPGLDVTNQLQMQQWQAAAASGNDTFKMADLESLVALSAQDAWAVGSLTSIEQVGQVPDQTLTMHWDGTQWAAVHAPDVQVAQLGHAAFDTLAAVGGRHGDVWAVGQAIPQGTLTSHWNGSAWSLVPSPATGINGFLDAVYAAGAGDVWAGGDEIDHWDGHTWRDMATLQGRSVAGISAVTGTGSNDVWFANATSFIHYVCG